MIPDKLYEYAFAYKKCKLWTKLWDSEMFALRFSDGEIGYICIMGKNGEYNALGVYVGDEGFESLIFNQEPEKEYYTSYFAEHEELYLQSCLHMCLESKEYLFDEEIDEVRAYTKANGIRLSGKNSYPQFKKFVPHKHPWFITSEQDQQYIMESLQAAIWLAKKLETEKPESLGIKDIIESESDEIIILEKKDEEYEMSWVKLPSRKDKVFPRPDVLDEITAAYLKKIKNKDVFECELIRVPTPIQSTPDEQPYFPVMLMMISRKTGRALPIDIAPEYESNPNIILQELVDALKNYDVCPKRIMVRDQRTFDLLEEFCHSVGAEIKIKENLEYLDDAEDDFLRLFVSDEDIDDEIDNMIQVLDRIEQMSDRELKKLPKEFIQDIINIVEMEDLPIGMRVKADMILERIFDN